MRLKVFGRERWRFLKPRGRRLLLTGTVPSSNRLLDIEAYTWFAPIVAYGELFVGIALIIGAFTGIAAFFWRIYELEFHDGRHGPAAILCFLWWRLA